MKKNQVNALLTNQTKRRNTVFALICLTVICAVISLGFILLYVNSGKNSYVSYDETSDIDYKVYLKNNDFFDETYLGTESQYIASLINNIVAKFDYKLSIDEKDVGYKYSYRIDALVDVKHKDANYSLYSTTKEMVPEKEEFSTEDEVIINEEVNIDYNYFNDLMKKFVTVYDLDDIESTLSVNMYVKVIGSCEEFSDDGVEESVMSLSIPLTTKTMGIEISDDLIDSDNNVMLCKDESVSRTIFLILSILFGGSVVGLIIYTVRFEIKTRTAENIYERELKKILNNYSSYIQKLESDFDFKDYQLLKISAFSDMLEISERIMQPILMRENDEKNGAYFLIPSSTKILYVYRVKVIDIEKKFKFEKSDTDTDTI